MINERGNKDFVETNNLKKIIEHLTFIRINIPLTRISKNDLRIIVRKNPVCSKISSEDFFFEAKLQQVSKLPVTSSKEISARPPVKEQKQKMIK